MCLAELISNECHSGGGHFAICYSISYAECTSQCHSAECQFAVCIQCVMLSLFQRSVIQLSVNLLFVLS
jgi:hypothetical protein